MEKERKQKKQNKLLRQSYFLITALFLSVFLLLFYGEYQSFLRAEMERNLNQTVLKAELTRQWMADRYEQFSVLANIFSMAELPSQKMKLLREFETINSQIYKNLYYVDGNYNTLDSQGRGSVSQSEFRKIFDQVGQSETSLLTKAEFLQDSKEPVFSVIAAIRSEEKVLRGILVGVISLQGLQEHLANAGFNPDGEHKGSTWILDSQKKTILHSNQNIILDFQTEGDDGYKDVSQLSKYIDNNASGTIRYTVKNHENLFVSFVKTKISDGWVIMMGQVEISFWRFLQENWLLKLAVLLTGGLLLCLWQSYVYQKTMQPFTVIKDALISFNTGNRYINLEVKPGDPSYELTGQIRKLTETVIEQSYNVENLIRERTRALSDLNKTISFRNKDLSEINAALTANNDHLHHRAMTDMLTQLINRQELLNMTDELISEAKKDSSKTFSILFLDLDNFKKYNDNFSHDVGDFVLKSIAALVQNNVRAMDLSARYGGDEFVIVINHSEMAAAVATAERILQKIKGVGGYAKEIGELLGHPVEIEPQDQIACSIGVVHYVSELKVANAEDLMTLADDMMYQAKKSGKGRIEIYEPKPEELRSEEPGTPEATGNLGDKDESAAGTVPEEKPEPAGSAGMSRRLNSQETEEIDGTRKNKEE